VGIGASLVLLVVGGILAFAVTVRVSVVDIPTVGVILVLAGLLGLALTLVPYLRARSRDRDLS
jgi:hypothetical protein